MVQTAKLTVNAKVFMVRTEYRLRIWGSRMACCGGCFASNA